MKFGESLSEGLVPEWKNQYVNYKQGKKLIKKIAQLKDDLGSDVPDSDPTNNPERRYRQAEQHEQSSTVPANEGTPLLGPHESSNIPNLQRLKSDRDSTEANQEFETAADSSNSDNNDYFSQEPIPIISSKSKNNLLAEESGPSSTHDENSIRAPSGKENPRKQSIFNYSLSSSKDKKDQYRDEKKHFFGWLEEELIKVDRFYKEKEFECYERFLVLQDQLYQLRDHKMAMMKIRVAHFNTTGHNSSSKATALEESYHKVNDFAYNTKQLWEEFRKYDLPSLPSTTFLNKWKLGRQSKHDDDTVLVTRYKTADDEYDPNFQENQVRNGMLPTSASYSIDDDDDSRSLDSDSNYDTTENSATASPRHASIQVVAENTPTPEMRKKSKKRDYGSKQKYGVPYAYARKQLKEALVEHYRALSLVKSYKTLNRTAFRKITKKYDKSTHSAISASFMKRVDNEALFQVSDLVDKLTSHVEELYMAFFDPEAAGRKHGLEKLKSAAYAYNNMDIRGPSFYGSLFISGLSIGFAVPLLILGLYDGVDNTLNGKLPEGSFLLQVWGGFFILNMNFILFAINLFVFDKFKINYKFIFEFNVADAMDYRQFLLVPSVVLAVLGLLFWFSFENFFPDVFPGRDWPWIYLGIALIVFFWPGKQMFASGRRWLQVALWRLLLSGFYPVEFRDFFLGDVFSSLTYTMGNISFFFCLYANQWNGSLGGGPPSSNRNVCGSSKSRLMGFFSTLPSVWRALQCIRRFSDTGDWFPHLANLLKYTITALYYCLLSVWRIDRTQKHRILFIVFATMNSLYTSTWDIVMDWSLLQPGSKNTLLRDHLFFGKAFYYYAAMVVDVILRFQWIFYAFFSNQIQQSAVTSFSIAVAELFRRFVWIFFRMENEHCTNVTLFRASRDSPLPYTISTKVEKAVKKLVSLKYKEHQSLADDASSEEVGVLTHPRLTGGSRSGTAPGTISQTSGYYSRANHFPERHPTRTSGVALTGEGDEEADLGLSSFPSTGDEGGTGNLDRINNKPSVAIPQLARRKSTFINISDILNKAHIKDFQRKKKPVPEHDSDDDDDDDSEEYDDHPENASTIAASGKQAGVPLGSNL